MNKEHLTLCASAEWADAVQRWIIPWVFDGIELGPDVLELGPGPGRTTEILQSLTGRLTAVELDPALAAALQQRLPEIAVIEADATALPFPDNRFSDVVCLTMLHHVPSPAAQDALFAEALRVLQPGGRLLGQDSRDDEDMRRLHVDDIYVPIEPASLGARLTQAGFGPVEVDLNDYAVRFRATTHA